MSVEVFILPSDIKDIIRMYLVKEHLASPSHQALMAQIRLFKEYYPFWTLPVKMKPIYFGVKTYDNIFSKPYWYCELTSSKRNFIMSYKFDVKKEMRKKKKHYKLKHRLIEDGVLDKKTQELTQHYQKIIYTNYICRYFGHDWRLDMNYS
jgi:hypothetical protein